MSERSSSYPWQSFTRCMQECCLLLKEKIQLLHLVQGAGSPSMVLCRFQQHAKMHVSMQCEQ